MPIGGSYPAEQNEDGTWDIKDVPIFAFTPEGARGNDEPIDAKWMKKAIKKAKQRMDEGYLAPLHILHHEPGVQPERAGHFIPTHVGTIRHDGEDVDALYARLVKIPDRIFQRIRAEELPFRSVEIFCFESPEINSLALLDTEVPFFRLPLLTVGETVVRETREDSSQFEDQPLVAMAAGSGAGAYLFRFKESDMGSKTAKKFMPPKDDEEEKVEVNVGDDEEEPEKMEADSDVTDAVEKITSIMEPLGTLIAQLQKLLGGGEATPGEGQPVEMKAKATGAAAEGRIAALEAFKAETIREKKIAALVSEAEDRLEGDGYHLADSTRTRIRKFAAVGKEELAEFVASFREHATPDPRNNLETLPGKQGTLPHEVSKYAEQGPEALAEARRAHRDWLELKESKHFKDTVSPLAKYLERNVRIGG